MYVYIDYGVNVYIVPSVLHHKIQSLNIKNVA
jgi:hypothetical protein